jgi:hypothetical protein
VASGAFDGTFGGAFGGSGSDVMPFISASGMGNSVLTRRADP